MRLSIFALSFLVVTISCAQSSNNPVEAGLVKWGRNFDGALEKSAQTGKPVLVLFQEIPGCSGCQTFGKTVLSHPLIVEAIEDEFVPVLIYNNKYGEDRKILEKYDEPSWNYQVIRFLNSEGKDIIPRKDRVWDIGGIAQRMIKTLNESNRQVPKYLNVVAEEYSMESHKESAFSMYCFWAGEVDLGQIDGVVSTEAGWLEGNEVTRIVYDKDKITLKQLAKKARNNASVDKIYTPDGNAADVANLPSGKLNGEYSKAKNSDQKKQLENWEAVKNVPGLTEIQLTKVNAYFPFGKEKALEWLSPRQQKALADMN